MMGEAYDCVIRGGRVFLHTGPDSVVDAGPEAQSFVAAFDLATAQDLFDAYLPLARYEQQPGIGLAVRKHILASRGVIASAHIRRPGPALSAADVGDIARLTARQQRRLAQLGA